MRVAIADLLGNPGATRQVSASIERGDLDAPAGDWGPGDEALASPIDLDLVLEMLLDGLLARGRVSFLTSVPCARCLTDVTADRDVAVSELFVDPRRLDEDDDEIEAGYEILPDGVIDLDALLRDAIVSTIPVRTLCREDCAGLCPTCGADRNVQDCGHEQRPEPDPRWAALQGLDLPPG